MINQSHEHHGVLDAIADWVKRYREAIGLRSEMANCTPEQVAVIARDMGLSPVELLSITAKGPHAADELPRLLRALGVDPQKLASDDPGTMRDLQQICVTCGQKVSARTISPGGKPRATITTIVQMRFRSIRYSTKIEMKIEGSRLRLAKKPAVCIRGPIGA